MTPCSAGEPGSMIQVVMEPESSFLAGGAPAEALLLWSSEPPQAARTRTTASMAPTSAHLVVLTSLLLPTPHAWDDLEHRRCKGGAGNTCRSGGRPFRPAARSPFQALAAPQRSIGRSSVTN